MATTTSNTDHIVGVGRVFLRWTAALAFVLIAIAAMMDSAAAERSPASYQQNFVKECRERGGTTERVGTRVVKCTLSDGYTVTCDFKTNPPTCTKPAALVDVDVADVTAEYAGGDLAGAETAPGSVGPGYVADREVRGAATVVVFEEQP